MKRMVTIFTVVILILAGTVFAGQPLRSQIRDPQGKLLGTEIHRGGSTELRSPTGKLELKSTKTPSGTTDVRDPSGKLLYKVK